MKPIMSSPEVFSAYATIDLNLYFMSDLKRELADLHSGSPIDLAVKNVTGYTKDKEKEIATELIGLLEVNIQMKKIIEADYSNDEAHLNQIKALLA